MTRVTDLTPLLKQLRLGQMAATLPERIALARREQLDYASFLEIILSDEVNRRAHRRIEVRLKASVSRRPVGWRTSTGRRRLHWIAGCWMPFSPWSFWTSTSTSSWWDRRAWARAFWPRPWATPPSAPDTPSASATPTTSSRPWHRPGWTTPWTAPSGPSSHRICSSSTTWASTASPPNSPPNLYDLILNRHRSSSFVITSNRAVEEWLSLFDDPILGNSALDRLANASYQIVIEGSSYRERLSPHRALLSNQGGD